ncbi:MAG: acylphosphatase [Rhodospirillales bacterium]
MADKAVRVVIEGRVQGVFFRAWTTQEAERRSLSGWVRNRMDGTVEALFSGDGSQVDEMVGLCRRGPPAASVVNVTEHPADAPPEPGFRYAPTV